MSQPCDRSCKIPTPGSVDASLGEFWVENPWEIVKNGHNLSCFERKRTWMNIHGSNFIDLSYLTGADNDGWLDLYATAGFVSRDHNKPDG